MSAPVGTLGYTAVVVTFRRSDALSRSLAALLGQTSPPSLVVVVDNDPECSARGVVDVTPCPKAVELVYLPSGENLGPAGGWARGVEWALGHATRGDWCMVLDDDDPIGDPEVSGELLTAASAASSDVAALGLRGAVWHAPTATLRRVMPHAGRLTPCDYLASGGMPIYRWAVIDRFGFFDESLFFGFEDLDLGLRLREADLKLAVVSIDSAHRVPDTNPVRLPWREYFKTRALVTVCRRHSGVWALMVTTLRSVMIGGVLLALRDRNLAIASARWSGWRDAMRGRLGRHRYVPSHNPAKAS